MKLTKRKVISTLFVLLVALFLGGYWLGLENSDYMQSKALIFGMGGQFYSLHDVPDPIIRRITFNSFFEHCLGVTLNEPPFRNSIDFRNKPITDDQIASLQCATKIDIRMLDLCNTRITDRSASFVAQLSKLERLDLSETSITSAFIEELPKLSNLQFLKLRRTSIDDGVAQNLALCKNLISIDLRGTRVGLNTMHQLAELPKLAEVVLGEGEVKAEYLKVLAKSKSIDTLALQQTNLDADCWAHFPSLPNLRNLDLFGTPISVEGAKQIARCRKLEYLFVKPGDLSLVESAVLLSAIPKLQIVTNEFFD